MFTYCKSMLGKHKVDVGLLLLRIALGSVFMVHGLAKWNNMEMTTGFINGMLHLPVWFAYLLATLEVASGAAMLLGIFTNIAACTQVAIMLGAIILVHWKNGFMGQGGYEYPFTLLLMAAAVAQLGAGKFAIMKEEITRCATTQEVGISSGAPTHGT